MPATLHRRRTASPLVGTLLPALAATLALAPAAARANDRGPRATPVPGAGCAEIARNTGNNPWSSGGYLNVGGAGQYLASRCPLPLNQVDLSGTTNDNDISKTRVHYVDTDGLGGLAGVATDPVRVAVPAGGALPERTVVCSWSSNVDGSGATTPAKATKPCVHDLAAEAFYHLEVTLRSDSGSHGAAFLGIAIPQ